MTDVDEILKRISAHKGVLGVLITNADGIPVRTNMDNSTTVQYANQLKDFISLARSVVRDLDPMNDLTFLRIRSRKHEILISPEKIYSLVVIQNPSE